MNALSEFRGVRCESGNEDRIFEVQFGLGRYDGSS